MISIPVMEAIPVRSGPFLLLYTPVVLRPAQKLQVWKMVCTSFNQTRHNTCQSRILKNDVIHVCMSYRVLPLTYQRSPSSHKDRKGSFMTRPTGKVPSYKNVIKRAYCLQQPACWHNTSKAVVACLGVGENQRAWRKTTASLYGTGKLCRHNKAQVQTHTST